MTNKPVHISKIYYECKTMFYNYKSIWYELNLLDYETLWELYSLNNHDVIKLKEILLCNKR